MTESFHTARDTQPMVKTVEGDELYDVSRDDLGQRKQSIQHLSEETNDENSFSIREAPIKDTRVICCKMRLNERVTGFNVFSLIASAAAVQIVLTLQVSFVTYLLEGHYGIDTDDEASTLGTLGIVGDIASVSSELLLGTAMDLFGRKIPVVGGVFLAGMATFISPLPKRLLGLYFARSLANIGCIPSLWSPYGADYVAPES